VAGKKLDLIEEPQTAVVVHTPPGALPDGGLALFADGHVEWLEGDAFKQAIERPVKFAEPAQEKKAEPLLVK
jgi:hypothetical protein